MNLTHRWTTALLTTAGTGLALAGPAEAAAPRPNIIFILTDDLGYGDLGVFYQNSRNFSANRNQPAFVTPSLDTLAANGMRLTRHYCPAPVCAPSRASLLLGVTQGHANVRDNQFDKALEDNHTLGTVLQGAGYSTAVIGKWGLQGSGVPTAQAGHPLRHGFDYFFGFTAHLTGHFHYAEKMAGQTDNQGQPCAIYDGYTDITSSADKCYSTDLFTARAKKWIVDQHAADPAKPFFLYLALTAPHAQLNVPTQAYPAGGGLTGGVQWTGTPDALINTASGTIDSWIHPDYASATYDSDNNSATPEVAWPDYAKRHATMIRRIDDALCDLRQLLTDLGIADNTLLVFTSDNGPHNEAGTGGSYTQDPRFFRSYATMDGVKRDVLEAGMREPTIVCWPAGIAAGQSSSFPCQFQDWMPTWAELAGVPAPARSDGVSLVPTLTGTGTQRPGVIYTEYNVSGTTPSYTDFLAAHRGQTRNQQQVIWVSGYKGLRTDIASHSGTDFKIYDTLADPQEATNLVGQAGVPTQQDFKDAVLRVRRPNSSAARPYDSELVPPLTPSPVRPGVAWRAFEASYPWVPSFTGLPEAAAGETARPDVAVRTRDDQIGLEFKGYLNVPADGTYTFYLTTDTGAFLRLHDMQVLDADFPYTGGTEISASVHLKAGKHPFTLGYRRATGGTPALSLSWSSAALAKQTIPDSAFYTDGEIPPSPPTAADDTATTTGSTTGADTSVLVNALANDTDDGAPSPLAIAAVDTPAGGTAAIESNQIRYTPRQGFFGTDTFGYTISDGADTDTATVTVEVYAVSDALYVWLPFDETSGTVAHDAGGRPLGTLQNFANTTTCWTTGRWGGALTFDGTDDKVVLRDQKGITGTAARTICFWLHAAATQVTANRPTMISWGASNGTTAGIRFDINLNHTSGYLLRSEFNSSGVNFSTAARRDLRGAGWVHCAVVVPVGATVSQVQGYLDGVPATATLEPSGAGGTAINTTSANDITLGNWATDGTRPLTGLLDDVRIYPRALSAAEIAALAADPHPLSKAWFFRNFGNPEPAAGDWTADADGDGAPNLAECAQGTRAQISDGDPFHSLGMNGAAFRFCMQRRVAGTHDLIYRVQSSNNLANPAGWAIVSPVEVSAAPLAGQPGLETVVLEVNAGTYNADFFRCLFELP